MPYHRDISIVVRIQRDFQPANRLKRQKELSGKVKIKKDKKYNRLVTSLH